jgi:hypothetical protein
MHNGYYGIYKGKEYKVSKDQKGDSILLTSDKSKIDTSFFDKYNSGVYRKKINRDELTSYYSIDTYAMYKGFKLPVNRENTDSYYLVTDTAIGEKIGFDMIEKGVYGKWIPKSEVNIIIDKKIIEP